MPIEFKDYSAEVIAALDKTAIKFLNEAAGEIKSQAKRKSPVDNRHLGNSWTYIVDESKGKATVGSPLENAVWNEFGTGEYALEGKGRKSPWYIPVDSYTGKKAPTFQGKVVVVYGKDGKAFYKTDGKKPQRTLQTVYNKLKPKLIKRGAEILKEEMS